MAEDYGALGVDDDLPLRGFLSSLGKKTSPVVQEAPVGEVALPIAVGALNALPSDPRIAVFQQMLDPAVTKRTAFAPVVRTMRPTGDTMVPEEITSREFGAPQVAVDMLESFMLPGAVRKGYTPTMQDAAQFSLDAMFGGGLLGSAPRGSLAANVFHGGPHKFAPEPGFPYGRPRLDKMGTGEGAQAYGPGFYSAEARGVATDYRDVLTPPPGVKVGGNTMTPFEFQNTLRVKALSKYPDMPVEEIERQSGNAARMIFNRAEELKNIDGSDNVLMRAFLDSQSKKDDSLSKILRVARDEMPAAKWSEETGTLYKLDIPDADAAKTLDWDAPLSEQPKHIKKAWDDFKKSELGIFADESLGGNISAGRANYSNPTGKDIYGAFVEGAATKVGPEKFAEKADYDLAAKTLREAGIPGVKYLDQGSRGAGAGSRNYAIWDQDVLDRMKMLERDGVTLGANKSPAAAAPGLLGRAPSRETKQPSQMTSAELRAEANAARFGDEDLSINQTLAQSAKDYFGITRDPSETGYILQDGTRLDLSGRHYAGGYVKQGDRYVAEKGKADYLGGDRAVDHRELYDLPGIKEGEHSWDAVQHLMTETGAVRYIPNTGFSIIAGQKVSDKQLRKIVSDFRKSKNPLEVDIDPVGGGSRAISKTFENPTVDGVKEFLNSVTLGANKSPIAATAGLLSRLPMDEQNRMARAEGLGFDFDGFHGTGGKDISEMSGMTWMSESPRLANEYAAMRANSSDGMASQIMPLKARTGNVFNAGFLPKSVTINHMMNEVLDQAQNNLGRTFSDGETDKARKLLGTIREAAVREESGPNYSRHDFWNDSESIFGKDGAKAIKEIFRMSGFDSISMREGGENTIGILNPSNIRSRFAAFDPAKANSENILAANAAPLGALSQLPEEAGVE